MSANHQTATRLPDTSMVNTPVPESTIFAECWSAVQLVLDYCLSHSPADIKTWFDATNYITTYTAVYKYCVAPRLAAQGESPVYFHGEKLYKQLESTLGTMFGGVGDRLSSLSDDQVIVEYNKVWERVAVMARHVEAIFMYVERHWIERQIQSKNTRTTPDIYRIKQLVFIKWQSGVINKIIEGVKKAMVSRLGEEREAGSLEFNDGIKTSILAFQAISADITPMSSTGTEPSKVRTFPDIIEPLYLSCLEEHVKTIASTVQDLDHLRAVWDEEQARAAFYLPSSQEKVKEVIKDSLFIPCMDMIINGFTEALMEWNAVKCLEIFALMEVQADLLNHLDSAVSMFCQQQLSHLPDSSPDLFVSAILKLYRSISDFIETSLKARQSMHMARDQSFRHFLKNHRGGRVHDMLAVSMDHALRDQEMRSDLFLQRIKDVISVFKLLDDKEVFRAHYSKLMSTRLLGSVTLSSAREQLVIDELNAVCGGGYTGSLQRMLSDKLASTDLTAQCLGVNKKAVKNEFTVVTSGSWPLTVPAVEFKWPEEFVNSLTTFTTNYVNLYKKRRLDWLPNQSRVEVEYEIEGRKCCLVLNAVQWAVLKPLFTDSAFMTADTIARQSQLSVEAVSRELELAAQVGLLSSKTGSNNRIGYQVNSAFEPKSPIISLFSGRSDAADQDVVMTETNVTSAVAENKTDEECRNIILAAIVKTCKRTPELELSKLIQAIQNHVQPWIPGCPADRVMSCVEMAIDKEYIKRVAADIVQYLP